MKYLHYDKLGRLVKEGDFVAYTLDDNTVIGIVKKTCKKKSR